VAEAVAAAGKRGLSLFFGVVLAGCAALTRPDGWSFALLGDAPYSEAEAQALDRVIDHMNAEALVFVAHVGDITSGRGPCSDQWFAARLRQFARVRQPFVLLPGDNDWTDCHRGGFDPLERLAAWRKLFCFRMPEIGLVRQPGEYCEHVRWEVDGLVFVGLNVPGSNNNLGRSPAMDAEHERRMRAVFEWLAEAEALARPRAGLVVLIQGNPVFEGKPANRPDGFATFRARLGEIAVRLGKPVVLVHGDTHRFRDDRPAAGVRRIEVWGSPQVRWLRATYGAGRLHVEDD
jgi:hypothetical protein